MSIAKQIKKLQYKAEKTGLDLTKEIKALEAKRVEAKARTVGSANIPNIRGIL